MYKIAELYRDATSPASYATGYFDRLSALMQAVDKAALERTIETLMTAWEEGRTVYLLANGGSAAVASHFVNDAVAGAWVEGKPPLRAFSLTDNVESVTALANDCGYDNIFACQLRMCLRPGDVVLAMSVSGNSPNIVRGVELARELGAATIGWAGFDGGKLAPICDLSIIVPTSKDEYGPVEDMFSILEHVVLTYVALHRGRQLHH